MSFTHLHVHTEYSLLDGACRIEPMLDKIKAMGQNSVAVTDHGSMYGVMKFYNAAKERNIKPIIGCEVYVAPRSRFDKVHGADSKRYHLILLCKNNLGYSNLIKIVSAGWIDGFYSKPRIDRELLEKYHEGIIALSGCLFGEVSQHLLENEYNEAYETAKWYLDTFGEGNYFIEIQNHYLKEQLRINQDLVKLSRELNIPLVATNDAHYINKEDKKIQQVLLCIQTNKLLGEETGFDTASDELYIKSEEEMLSAFSFCPEAVTNTQIIADKCNVTFEFGNTKLPHFDVPDNKDHYSYFRELCEKGLTKRYGENPDTVYVERMNYELDIINRMGYTDYYLIVADFVNYAKSVGIPVGPGRGSGAASICAYCIGITGIDPIKYNLLFERFLNPERVSMPDFDIDFCYERREEVISYVIDKYGSDHVAQIVSFGTLAAKAAVKDVGRVLGIPYNLADKVSKLIPNELDITISESLNKSKELKNLYDTDNSVRELIDISRKIEGMPRHTSTHAAGVVITADPVDSYVPLSKNDDLIVTQYTMKDLEKLGLLKMDFLGLKTLTVIDYAVKSIRKNNPDFDINKIDIDDCKVYKMLSDGHTEGVFQFESAGIKNVLSAFKPNNIEDINAILALYRPGPIQSGSIDKFIQNKNNSSKITYKTPALKNILEVTNGSLVYQEQVMQICRDIAGYTFGRADIVRRAMAKKQHDVMLKERNNFIYGITDENGNVVCEGAVKRGVDEKTANEIFDEMISFASYAFNKAHSASYAFISYQTAYLKCYYPMEYFAALMTSCIDRISKISMYIRECKNLGIKILPPHVNLSSEKFEANEKGISFSLCAIKNIGVGFVERMTSERKSNGNFKSLYDFCNRLYGRDLNRKSLECLIMCGAFDNLGASRKQMLTSIDSLLTDIDNKRRKNIDGQIDFFGLNSVNDNNDSTEFEYPVIDEYSLQEKLRMEKEVSGLYFSGHPMDSYKEISEKLRCDEIVDILNDEIKYKDNSTVTLLCQFNNISRKQTKNNSMITFIDAEDSTGNLEFVVFSKQYELFRHLFFTGNTAVISGRVSRNDDGKLSVITESVQPLSEADKINNVLKNQRKEHTKPTDFSNAKILYIRFDSSLSPQVKVISNLLSIFDGKLPVKYFYSDTKEYVNADGVMINDVLINELNKILGKENVILK